MSQSLSNFVKNDRILIEKVNCELKLRTHLEALGIFEGASAEIFYRDTNNLILKIGETKIALSQQMGNLIFSSEKIQ